MRKALIVGLVAGGSVFVVVLTVSLVLTQGSDSNNNDPPPDGLVGPHLDKIVAKASEGSLVGLVSPEAGMFIGVPFSQPPVGDLRWRDPLPPKPYSEDYYNATYERSSCIQICRLPAPEYSCPEEDQFHEDCLFLNIWVPHTIMKKVDKDGVIDGEHYIVDPAYQNGDSDSLAVMVFFYGGNFLVGSASVELYDNRFLAKQGNIVGVTVNYRVGPLGFLVQGSGDDAAKGNFGIQDQVRSLEWVQENIKYFGGNPNKVTIYGQSAGAESIGVHMTSPYIRDRQLFHQCIMQSNPFALPFRDWDNAMEFGGRFAEAAGCMRGDMDCLRKLDTDTILQAYRETALEVVGLQKLFLLFQPWGPVIDGDFLPEQPVDSFGKGNVVQIPCMMGIVAHEAQSYIYGTFSSEISNVEYRAIVYGMMKEDAPAILDRYGPLCDTAGGPSCDNRDLMEVLTTLYLFMCPTKYSLDRMIPDSYYYIFNETWSFKELWGFGACYDKVCHAAELPYVFNMENLTTYRYEEDERIMSARMAYYWTNFAKYGNPNGDPGKVNNKNRLEPTEANDLQVVYWPKFKEDGSDDFHAMHISAGLGDYVITNLYKDDCDFCDSLNSYGDH